MVLRSVLCGLPQVDSFGELCFRGRGDFALERLDNISKAREVSEAQWLRMTTRRLT